MRWLQIIHQKHFHELILYLSNVPLKEDFEKFFIDWKNRVPFSLILVMDYLIDDEIIDLIENYKKLGIIKKFEILTQEYVPPVFW